MSSILTKGIMQQVQVGANVNPVLPAALELTFNDIVNADLLIGDSSEVANWNTFFNLPTNGNPFTSVEVDGNIAKLYGGTNIIISEGLFAENANLVSVDDNAECIIFLSESCFGACESLVSVSLPACLEVEYTGNIDYGTFGSCPALTTINMPSLIIVGAYWLYDTYTVATVTISEDIIELGEDAFSNSGIVSLSLPNLTTVGYGCFMSCENLVTLNAPLLRTISDYAFSGCTVLAESYFMSQLTSIADGCFSKCLGLISPDFSQLLTIDGYSFDGCINLINPNFSSVTTIIGNGSSFNGCTNLANPDFSSLQNISGGQGHFKNCPSLIGNFPVLTRIEDDAVYCFQSSLVSLSAPLLEYLGAGALNGSLLTTLTLESVTNCGYNTAIGLCPNLISATLPSLVAAPDALFANNPLLEVVNLPSCITVNTELLTNCFSITTIDLSSCINLGPTTEDNHNFWAITGNTITLKIPIALMTASAGVAPDGDIAILNAENTVTIIYSD